MFDEQVRRLKDSILNPMARLLTRFCAPLAMTLIAFAIALAACYALARAHYSAALLLWVLSRICDGLDGAMARVSGRQSALGGYLDLMCDACIYALFPIAAASVSNDARIAEALILLLATYYVNIVSWAVLAAILEKRARAHSATTTIIMPRGIIEGLETVIIYALFCIIPDYLLQLFIVTAMLVALSAGMRVVWAIKNRRQLEENE